jgi:hypothetical protein
MKNIRPLYFAAEKLFYSRELQLALSGGPNHRGVLSYSVGRLGE